MVKIRFTTLLLATTANLRLALVNGFNALNITALTLSALALILEIVEVLHHGKEK